MTPQARFFKKLFMLILCFLCFYFGAKGQSTYRLTGEVYQNSLNGSTWNNRLLKIYEYNNLSISPELPSAVAYWNYQNGVTVRDKKEFVAYQLSPTQISERQFFLWNSNNSQYDLPHTRVQFTYGTSGPGTVVTAITQNYVAGAWVNALTDAKYYDAQGKLIEHVLANWNNNTPVIHHRWQVLSFYSNNKPYRGILTLFDPSTGAFSTAVRATYTYLSNGAFETIIDERKSTANGNFVNELKSTYTYNNAGKLGVIFSALWNGSAWVTNGETEYTYTTNNGFTTAVAETFQYGNPNVMQHRVTETTIDSYNKLYERYFENWSNGTWNKIWRYHYTYNAFTTATNEVATATVQPVVYPNPTVNQLKIKGLEIKEPMPYRIFDAQGRIVLSGFLRSTDDNIETAQLAKGNYVLTLNRRGVAPVKFLKF